MNAPLSPVYKVYYVRKPYSDKQAPMLNPVKTMSKGNPRKPYTNFITLNLNLHRTLGTLKQLVQGPKQLPLLLCGFLIIVMVSGNPLNPILTP